MAHVGALQAGVQLDSVLGEEGLGCRVDVDDGLLSLRFGDHHRDLDRVQCSSPELERTKCGRSDDAKSHARGIGPRSDSS